MFDSIKSLFLIYKKETKPSITNLKNVIKNRTFGHTVGLVHMDDFSHNSTQSCCKGFGKDSAVDTQQE